MHRQFQALEMNLVSAVQIYAFTFLHVVVQLHCIRIHIDGEATSL